MEVEEEVNRKAHLAPAIETAGGMAVDEEASSGRAVSGIAQAAVAAGKSAAAGNRFVEATRNLTAFTETSEIIDYTAGIKPSSSHYLFDVVINDTAKVIAVRDGGADDTIITTGAVRMLGVAMGQGYSKLDQEANVLGSTCKFVGLCERVKLSFGDGLECH